MKKVSFIIPAYNAEKTIEKCIQSILAQSYKNIEIIVINDGSTDATEAICKEYSHKNPNIQIYTQENGGVSSARNLGLEKVTGEYIQFVDADDYIDADMTETMVNQIKGDGEWIICSCVGEEEGTQQIIKMNASQTMGREETLRALVEPDSVRGYLVNKLFETRIIRKHQLRMKTDVFVCEDLIFCLEYAEYVEKAIYLNRPFYHYVYREDSVTHKKYSPKRFSSIDAFETIKNVTQKYGDEILNKKVEAHYLILVIQLFVMLKRNHYTIKTAEMKRILNIMKQRKLCLFGTNWDLKYKLVSVPLKMLSILCG